LKALQVSGATEKQDVSVTMEENLKDGPAEEKRVEAENKPLITYMPLVPPKPPKSDRARSSQLKQQIKAVDTTFGASPSSLALAVKKNLAAGANAEQKPRGTSFDFKSRNSSADYHQLREQSTTQKTPSSNEK